MNSKQVIRKGKELLEQNDRSTLFNNFGRVYGMTTENVKGTFARYDFNGKDILTVCSSGDHILGALLKGANNVDAFDLNALTEYYFHFKKALIVGVSFSEFREFLVYNLIPTGRVLLKTYKKFRDYIEMPYRDFWDEIISYGLSNELDFRRLFINSLNSSYRYDSMVDYYSEEDYSLLQERIGLSQVNFIHSDLKKLSLQLESKYDYMFLSNIADYVGVFETKKIAQGLLPFVKDGGEIAFAYLYDITLKRALNYSSDLFEVDSVIKDASDYVLTLRKK